MEKKVKQKINIILQYGVNPLYKSYNDDLVLKI